MLAAPASAAAVVYASPPSKRASRTIRPLEPADVPGVLALDQANDPRLRELGDLPCDELVATDMPGKFWTQPEIVAALRRPDDSAWDVRVARRGRQVVGAIFTCIRVAGPLFCAPNSANAVYVSWLGVHPDARRAGIGLALLRSVMNHGAWEPPPGHTELLFYAHVDERDAATLRLFGRAGFKALAQVTFDECRFFLLGVAIKPSS